VTVTKNGESASASWGGFHASASLADDGSAAASAGNSVLGAGAGLYGTAGAAANAGGYGNGGGKPGGGKPGDAGGVPLYHQGGAGFFDRIFAVSMSATVRGVGGACEQNG